MNKFIVNGLAVAAALCVILFCRNFVPYFKGEEVVEEIAEKVIENEIGIDVDFTYTPDLPKRQVEHITN